VHAQHHNQNDNSQNPAETAEVPITLDGACRTTTSSSSSSTTRHPKVTMPHQPISSRASHMLKLSGTQG